MPARHPASPSAPSCPSPARRRLLGTALAGGTLAGVGGTSALWPALSAFAKDVEDFIVGPPVTDIAAERLTEHVWMIFAKDGFPTPENRGMMSNICFVQTQRGVVMLDPGASLQIGEMALRQIRKLTDKPVVAIFNSHYHGDHWLANHAFVNAFGAGLPIHAHPVTRKEIEGVQGSSWRTLMEQWTNQSTAGTRIVPPNRDVSHGQTFDFGDVHLRVHHYGTAHTPGDICVEVVEDKLVHVGDVAMHGRIANMDDGSYPGSLAYMDALDKAVPGALWLPGHGRPGKDVLNWQREMFAGIYEACVAAVKASKPVEAARAAALADPRVASKASVTQGFDNNIGKYVSLAYLEAEKENF